MRFQNIVEKVKSNISWQMMILIVAGIACFVQVLRFSSNVPYGQDLSVFPVLVKQDTFLKFQGLNSTLFSNLFSALFYHLDGWQIKAHLMFNFFIYLANVILLYRIIVKASGEFKYLPLFFVPLWTDMNALNFMQTASTSQFLTVFFGLWAADVAIRYQDTPKNMIIFYVLLSLSSFSMNFMFALGVSLVFVIHKVQQKYYSRCFLIAVVMAFIIMNFFQRGATFAFTSYSNMFDDFVLALSAVWTGFDIATFLHYVFILPIFIGLVIVWTDKNVSKNRALLLLYAVLFGVIFSAFAPSNAKNAYDFIHLFAGVGVFSIPVVATLLRLHKPLFIYFCIISCLGYSAALSNKYYKKEAIHKNNISICAQNYFKGTTDGSCLELKNSKQIFDLGKQLNIDFLP